MDLFLSIIRSPDEVPLDFINGAKDFTGDPDLLHYVGGHTTKGSFSKDSSISHVQKLGFSTSQFTGHIVNDGLEVSIDESFMEDWESQLLI